MTISYFFLLKAKQFFESIYFIYRLKVVFLNIIFWTELTIKSVIY